MELVGFLVVATAVLLFGRSAISEWWRLDRLPELPDHPLSEQLGDHAVSHEMVLVGEHPVTTMTGSDSVDIWTNRTTIFGLLPEWVAFGWTVDNNVPLAPPSDHNEVWLELLFGRITSLETGAMLYASGGDLVYESKASPHPLSSRTVLEVAKQYLRRQPDPIPGLTEYVLHRPPPTNTVAFRILARSAPDPSIAKDLAEQKRDTYDEPLAAAIATYEYPASRDRLVRLADNAHDDLARTLAVTALIEHGDVDALLELSDALRVPARLQGDFIQVLRKDKRANAEAVVLRYLDGPARDAAVDALAVLGTRAAVEPLLALKARGRLSSEVEIGVEVALELIRARLEGGAGLRGGLAVVEDKDQGGAVSLAQEGQLALTDDD